MSVPEPSETHPSVTQLPLLSVPPQGSSTVPSQSSSKPLQVSWVAEPLATCAPLLSAQNVLVPPALQRSVPGVAQAPTPAAAQA
jgi:D-tyrosyl-tRNA(Tyr) deacylase